jgi:hypothetical protein
MIGILLIRDFLQVSQITRPHYTMVVVALE